MAYADSIRATTARMNDVASLIEGQLIGVSETTSNGVINTTSTSLVDYTGASVSPTVGSGEKLLILFNVGVSASASGIQVTFDLNEDGGLAMSPGAQGYSNRALTSGDDFNMTNIYLRTPSAGAHTYKIRWRTASGTAYSISHRLLVFQFQNS